jgi:hypothetical protein
VKVPRYVSLSLPRTLAGVLGCRGCAEAHSTVPGTGYAREVSRQREMVQVVAPLLFWLALCQLSVRGFVLTSPESIARSYLHAKASFGPVCEHSVHLCLSLAVSGCLSLCVTLSLAVWAGARAVGFGSRGVGHPA